MTIATTDVTETHTHTHTHKEGAGEGNERKAIVEIFVLHPNKRIVYQLTSL